MAIQVPREVARFLNLCGIPHPDINEDDVRALGRHLTNFAANVRATHESATATINEMGSAYPGHFYEQLISMWSAMSSTHMAEFDRACKIVAKALDVAADVITAVMAAVLAELAALAASHAAVIAVPALAECAGPAITSAARWLCKQSQQTMMAYLAFEVVGKAVEPLEHAIDRMIEGVMYGAVRYVLGAPPNSSAVLPLQVEPEGAMHFAQVLDDHADETLCHAAKFVEDVAVLDFITGSHDRVFPHTDHPSVPIAC